MKYFSRIAVLVAGLFGSCMAMGGHGAGGGVFGITTGMLQAFRYSRALLSYEGGRNVLESNTDAQRLIIPQEEYIAFVQAVENEVANGGQALILAVDTEDGGKRYFELKHAGSVGHEPVLMYLVERSAPEVAE